MKWIGAVAGILITIAASLYVLLFTPLGNGIVKPILEKRINSNLPLAVKLNTFELTTDSFAITLALSESNRIVAIGNYSLFDQRLDAAYRIRLNSLSALEPLTKQSLRGKLHTEGRIAGTPDELHIRGISDLAQSVTEYAVVLTELDPTSIRAKITGAELSILLQMAGQKPYGSANVSLNLNLKNMDPKALDGRVVLALTNGHIDTALMKRDFNLTLPSTEYALKAISHLEGEVVKYTAKFESGLAYLYSRGNIIPESLITDLTYEINAKELALFRPLVNTPLRGPFSTKGTVRGNKRLMSIIGNSDIAASRTTYDISLNEFKPQRVVAKISGAKLDRLLHMSSQPRYATGSLDADITLENLDFDNLKGHADVTISKGELISKTFEKVYSITLPKTAFSYDLNARLKGKEVDFTTLFASNLAKLDAKGSITPKTMGMDLRYLLDIKKLELLKPLTDMRLRGPFSVNGTAKGDQKSLLVKGESNLANSRTTFSAQLAEFAPKSIKAAIKGLQLGDALYMVEQPHYGDATLDVDVDISDARPNQLKGTVTSVLGKGVVDTNIVAEAFGFKPMPSTTFSAKTVSVLEGTLIDTKAEITSSLAKLTIKKARYDLEKALITSDYTAEIPNLDKLFFVTERHLKGALTATGELKKGKELDLTAHSRSLGGTFDAKVHNEDIHADFKSIQTLDALTMLIYPPVFASSLEGTLDYNTESQKGVFNAKLYDGKFTPNSMLDMLKQLAGLDLYKETFTAAVKSAINKEHITTDLDMRSRTSSVTGKNIALNSKTQQIDAKLDIAANNHPVGARLSGNINNPKIEVDAGEALKKKAGKALEKEVNRLLRKLF